MASLPSSSGWPQRMGRTSQPALMPHIRWGSVWRRECQWEPVRGASCWPHPPPPTRWVCVPSAFPLPSTSPPPPPPQPEDRVGGSSSPCPSLHSEENPSSPPPRTPLSLSPDPSDDEGEGQGQGEGVTGARLNPLLIRLTRDVAVDVEGPEDILVQKAQVMVPVSLASAAGQAAVERLFQCPAPSLQCPAPSLQVIQKMFFDAAKRGNVARVRECHERGANLAAPDTSGWTALHHTAQLAHKHVLEYLVRASGAGAGSGQGWGLAAKYLMPLPSLPPSRAHAEAVSRRAGAWQAADGPAQGRLVRAPDHLPAAGGARSQSDRHRLSGVPEAQDWCHTPHLAGAWHLGLCCIVLLPPPPPGQHPLLYLKCCTPQGSTQVLYRPPQGSTPYLKCLQCEDGELQHYLRKKEAAQRAADSAEASLVLSEEGPATPSPGGGTPVT